MSPACPVTSVRLLLGACLLLLGAARVPTARADEVEAVTVPLLEGRWDDARVALWNRVRQLGRLDTRGQQVTLWRATWTVDAAGRAVSREVDDDAVELRRIGRKHVREGRDPRTWIESDHAVLEALYAERLLREVKGRQDLPAGSVLATLDDPSGVLRSFLAWQQHVYSPEPAEQSADADWAAKARAARVRAEDLQGSARRLAWLAGLGLLVLTLGLGARLGRRPRQG